MSVTALIVVSAAAVVRAASSSAVVTAGARPSSHAAATPLPSGGCALTVRPGDRTVRVQIPGATPRTARLHVPRAALGHPAALLLAFHGAGGTGRFMEGYSGLPTPLDAAGAIGVFPDGLGGHWQLTGAAAGADVAFVRLLLAAVEQRTCVDERRVSATGVSNGGGFAALLACDMADEIAAVAVVAGGFSSLPPCAPSRPVSILEIHGTDDPVVPYGGSPLNGRRGAVQAWLAGWVRRDRCARRAVTTKLVAHVDLLRWSGCAGATAVAHIRIAGGRHQWPGSTPPDPGPRAGFSAAREIWRFLANRRLPR